MNLICLLLMIMVKQLIVIHSINAAEFITSQQMWDYQRVDNASALWTQICPNYSNPVIYLFIYLFVTLLVYAFRWPDRLC